MYHLIFNVKIFINAFSKSLLSILLNTKCCVRPGAVMGTKCRLPLTNTTRDRELWSPQSCCGESGGIQPHREAAVLELEAALLGGSWEEALTALLQTL